MAARCGRSGQARRRSLDDGRRKLSAHLFEHGLAVVPSFTSPRTWAFALLGIHEYLRHYSDHPKLHIHALRAEL